MTVVEPTASPIAVPQPSRPTLARGGALSNWKSRLAFWRWPVVWQFFLALMVAYAGKEAISVVLFPPFTGHDEVAHYAYLRTVATEHRIPVLNEDRLPP